MLKNFKHESFDIIIQAGQSNSEGYGFGEAAHPFEPNPDIWYLNQDFTISMASEKVAGNLIQSNFSLSFAQQYIADGRLKDGRKLLIIRAAVGGTGFLDNHWKPQNDLFLQMTEMIKTARELNSNNKIIALLWHQGETDAILHADYQTHYHNLSTLVNLTRQVAMNEKLPFIAGDFVAQWEDENAEICAPVIQAIKDVCAHCGNGFFVETQELISNAIALGNEDTIHFCRESIYTLGQKYFEAFQNMMPKI